MLLTVPLAAAAALFSREVVRCQREQAVIEATVDRIDERTRSQLRGRLPLAVIYDYQLDDSGERKTNAQPPAPAWLRSWFGEHLFAEIREIQVSTAQIDEFTGWDQLRGLERISIRGSSGDFLPDGIDALTQVKELRLSWFPDLTNLNSLGNLKSLEKLRIQYCDSLTDLSGLQELKNLRELSFEQCPSISSLDDLAGLELNTLSMIDCREVKSLCGIESESLRQLTVRGCNRFEDVQAVSGMRNLETLHLASRFGSSARVNWNEEDLPTELTSVHLVGIDLPDLWWLSKCNGLRQLLINRCDSLVDLRGLESCSLLNELHLSCNSLESLQGLPQQNDISTVSIVGTGITDTRALVNLRDVETARFSFQLARIIDLPPSDRLQALSLELAPSIENLDGFPEYPQLTSLEITPGASLKDIGDIGHLKRLQDIAIWYCTSLNSLEGLSRLDELRSLKLYECRALTTLDGLPQSERLASIELYLANELVNIDAITNACSLEELAIEGAPAMIDCRAFEQLTDLKVLLLNQCENLQSLDGIEGLQSLNTLGIVDCTGLTDISALRQLPSLSTISYGNCPQIDAAQWTMLMNRNPGLQLGDF